MAKNLPAMQEIQVQPLVGRPPGEEMATHSSILAWRIPGTEAGYSPWSQKELDVTERPTLSWKFFFKKLSLKTGQNSY